MKWKKIKGLKGLHLNLKEFSIIFWEEEKEMEIPPRTTIDTRECFYTLKGDHRAQYEELAKEGVDACLEYWAKEKGKKGN